MQNFHSIAGLSGRVFGAGDGGAADHRRLRGYPSASMVGPLHPPLPVKCPRCDSVNTKFCYYNNYNLSQPRHFCKSCRRYWTKGGVLRNVPVGGGCRKPKRSSSKSNSADKDHRWSAASRSSLTAATGDEASASLSGSVNLFNSSSSNPTFDRPRPTDIQPFTATPAPTADIFSDATESFSSLMGGTAAANQSMLKFNFVDQPLLCLPDPSPPPAIHEKLEEIRTHELIHQMAPVELPHDGEVGGGISWLPVADAGIFELAGAGYPAAYWSQSHWLSDGYIKPSTLHPLERSQPLIVDDRRARMQRMRIGFLKERKGRARKIPFHVSSFFRLGLERFAFPISPFEREAWSWAVSSRLFFTSLATSAAVLPSVRGDRLCKLDNLRQEEDREIIFLLR